MTSAKISKVVFPVAGLGTRFLPATKAVPKEMLPVAGKPLIQWTVEEAVAAGCTEFIFVTSPEKSAIRAHFSAAPHYEKILRERNKQEAVSLLKAGLPDGAVIHEVFQREPLGLGHAVWCAHPFIGDEAFAVILPDDLILGRIGCLSEMVNHYNGGNLVALEEVDPDKTNQYGIADLLADRSSKDQGEIYRLSGLVEKPAPADAPSRLGVVGRYILDGSIMGELANQQAGAGNEIQLTDAIAGMIDTTPLNGMAFSGTRYDCGSAEGFLAANLAYALSPYGAQLGDALKQRLTSILKGK